jgi:hypothetical protein
MLTARALAQLIDHKTNVNSKLTHYLALNLWQWIKEYRQAFGPPVGNEVVSEDSQFTAMIIH